MSWRVQARAELELRRRKQAGDDPFAQFQAQYHDDPAGFVVDCIRFSDGGPAPYQLETLTTLAQVRRSALRGPHGLGKTALAAWAVLWFALTRDSEDWKVVTTASAWRQLSKFLWPEIRKWARRVRWDEIGRGPFDLRTELLTLSLKLETGEAFAVASDNADLIEGAHAAHLLYVFDEAKAIPNPTWDAAEGALSSGDCYALAISTPGQPQGRFYDIHSRKVGYGDWEARHVTLYEAKAAGRVSAEWAEQRKLQGGEQSAVYQNRVLGEFASSAEDNIIPLAWVEAAQERWREWDDAGRPPITGQRRLGVDIARFGNDKSCIAEQIGVCVASLEKWGKTDTMATTGRVKVKLRSDRANVDVIGIGSGVVDRLREQGCDVIGVNFGAGTRRRDKSGEVEMLNVRAAAWWGLRERLEPPSDIMLLPDDELTGDLTAPRYEYTSSGRLKVESKSDIRKRLGLSPDVGDAIVLAFWRGEPKKQKREVRSMR